MIPHDQLKAMADQRIERYRVEAASHRRIREGREPSGLTLLAVVREGLDRSGLRRIGDVLIGRQPRPAI